MKLSGVDQLDLRTSSVDLSVSKGFAFLTPYAGIGRVDVRSSAPGTLLKQEKFGLDKVFAGDQHRLRPDGAGHRGRPHRRRDQRRREGHDPLVKPALARRRGIMRR